MTPDSQSPEESVPTTGSRDVKSLTRRACDACSARRTKCSGDQIPCERCVKADLACTFTKPVKKKGPRGRILSQLPKAAPREDQHPTFSQTPAAQHLPSPLQYDQGESSNNFFSPFASTSSATWDNGGAFYATDASPAPADPGYLNNWGLTFPFSASPSNVLDHRPEPIQVQYEHLNHDPSPPPPPPVFAEPTTEYPVAVAPAPPDLSWVAIIADTVLRPQLDVFFERLHPVIPVFTRDYIERRMNAGEHFRNADFASMLLALSAFALIQPLSAEEGPTFAHRSQHALLLMHQAARLRNSGLFGGDVTVDAVLTSFFLFACLFGLGQHKAGFFRLREATCLGEAMELHVPMAYTGLSHEKQSMRLRTFWVLVITERAYAVQQNRSLTFRNLPGASMAFLAASLLESEDLRTSRMPNLQRMAHLFDFIDQGVVSCWNGECPGGRCTNFTAARVVDLQFGIAAPLRELASEHILSKVKSNDQQKADLLLTQQWLSNRVFQLALIHGLISEDSPQPEMRLSFAMSIAQTTIQICENLTPFALEANGLGIIEKIRDISLTVILIVKFIRTPEQGESALFTTSRQLIPQLITILAKLRGGHHPHLALVVEQWMALRNHVEGVSS